MPRTEHHHYVCKVCMCECVCLKCVYVNHKRNRSHPAHLCLEITDPVFHGNMAVLSIALCLFVPVFGVR